MGLVKWMNSWAGRAARVAAGVALIAVGVLTGGVGGVVLSLVGLVPLAAGAAGVCLLAPLMHVSARTH